MSNWGNSRFGSNSGFGNSGFGNSGFENSSFGKSNFNSWNDSYNAKNSKSFNFSYDESSDSNSYESSNSDSYESSSEESSIKKSWDYNLNTYKDSDGCRRDKETGRKVTTNIRSDNSLTHYLHPRDNIPGETKRNGKTVKKWKDNK